MEQGDDKSNEGKPQDLNPETPQILLTGWHTALGFLSSYGWLVLFVSIVLIIAWSVYLEPRISEWRRRTNERALEAALHRNPDLARSHQDAMTAARLRMQEKQDQLSAVYKEKQIQKEEAKKKEKEEEWEKLKQGKGYFSKTKVEDKELPDYSNLTSRKSDKKPRLRNNDYNPLMGQGSSGSGFRSAPSEMFRGGG